MVLLGLALFDCCTCHIMLFGSEMPTWEADHLITKYKLTFIRNSALNYKGLIYHLAFEKKMTYLLDGTNLLWKLKTSYLLQV